MIIADRIFWLKFAYFLLGLIVLHNIENILIAQQFVCKPNRVILGSTHVSGVLHGEFQLINNNNTIVTVYSIEPDCLSCTEITCETNFIIEPGDSITIPVSLRNLSTHEAHYYKNIIVRCSDSTQPRIELHVEGHFMPVIAPDRRIIDLGKVLASTTITEILNFTTWGELHELSLDHEYITLVVGKVLEIGTIDRPIVSPAQMIIHVPENNGKFRYSIEIKTNNPLQPLLKIIVMGEVTNIEIRKISPEYLPICQYSMYWKPPNQLISRQVFAHR